MSIKRIKFLSRKKILQTDIQIRLDAIGATKRFTAAIDLSSYEFPPEARVVIEAKQLLETQRFEMGTVGQPKVPAPIDISRLRGERVIFNLLVLEANSARKLGSAETVRPNVLASESEDSIPLLPVDASARVAPLLWRVDYTDNDQEGHTDAPVLMVDSVAAQSSAAFFMQDAAVRAMILPSAMREVLTKLMLIDQSEYEPGSRSWRNSWLRFASRLVGEDPPAVTAQNFKEEAIDWISEAVRRLSKSAAFLDGYIQGQRS